jgi:SAM-dependent methyltransferase
LAASQAGFDAKGIDVADASVVLARARGFEVWTGDPTTIDLTARFDVVTLWETIEHLPDPDTILRQIRRWLKPGGVLAIGTGNNRSLLSRLLGNRWWYLVPPDHCVYYNPRALAIVLERNGFRVERTYQVLSHLVSSRNALMKLLRSFQFRPSLALKIARTVPDIPIKIVHGTTTVVIARSLV